MKLAAVIADTRSADNITDAILRHEKFLPWYTSIVVASTPDILGTLNASLIWAGSLNTITIKPINSIDGYNRLLTYRPFWQALTDFDRVLIFQTDSGLLREGIEDFFAYSYVGAPWVFKSRGGNGGLSLRDPAAILEVLDRVTYSPEHGNEDIFYSEYLEGVAPRYICELFSVETIYKLGTLGYHAIDKHLRPDQVEAIKGQYLHSTNSKTA